MNRSDITTFVIDHLSAQATLTIERLAPKIPAFTSMDAIAVLRKARTVNIRQLANVLAKHLYNVDTMAVARCAPAVALAAARHNRRAAERHAVRQALQDYASKLCEDYRAELILSKFADGASIRSEAPAAIAIKLARLHANFTRPVRNPRA